MRERLERPPDLRDRSRQAARSPGRPGRPAHRAHLARPSARRTRWGWSTLASWSATHSTRSSEPDKPVLTGPRFQGPNSTPDPVYILFEDFTHVKFIDCHCRHPSSSMVADSRTGSTTSTSGCPSGLRRRPVPTRCRADVDRAAVPRRFEVPTVTGVTRRTSCRRVVQDANGAAGSSVAVAPDVDRRGGRADAVIRRIRRPSGHGPASPRCGRARGRPCGGAGTGSSTCRAACPPRTRRASPRRSGRGVGRARPASDSSSSLGRRLHALREVVTFLRQDVPNDPVAGAAAAADARPELRRDPGGRLVELGPRRAQQSRLAVECRRVERLAVERRGRERDAPEVGRASPRVAADDVEVGLGRELRAKPDALRDREVSRHVARELLDRLVLRLAASFETRPVRRDGDPALAPRGLFDEHPKLGRHRLIVPAARDRRRSSGVSRKASRVRHRLTVEPAAAVARLEDPVPSGREVPLIPAE